MKVVAALLFYGAENVPVVAAVRRLKGRLLFIKKSPQFGPLKAKINATQTLLSKSSRFDGKLLLVVLSQIFLPNAQKMIKYANKQGLGG